MGNDIDDDGVQRTSDDHKTNTDGLLTLREQNALPIGCSCSHVARAALDLNWI